MAILTFSNSDVEDSLSVPLKQYIQSKHQSAAEEAINTMIVKQKKRKCQVEGQATLYVKCAMSISDRDCGKMIKEAEQVDKSKIQIFISLKLRILYLSVKSKFNLVFHTELLLPFFIVYIS